MKIEKKVEVLEKEAVSLLLEAEKKVFRLCQRLMLWELKQNLRSEELTVVIQSLLDLEKELKSMVD